MTTCDVLRCTATATHVIRLSEEHAPLLQAAVCGQHQAQIDAGTPWRWEPDLAGLTQGSIVMGADLDAGPLAITKFIGTEEHGLVLAPDGGRGTTLVFDQLDQLHHTFEVWLRPRPAQDGGSAPES